MTRSDRWIGGIFLLLGSLVVLEASKLEFASSYGAGAGFFPYWVGAATIIVAIFLIAFSWRQPLDDDLSTSPTWSKKKLLALAALVVFVMTLEFLGFVTAFTFLVLFLLKVEGENWRRAVSVALASGIGFYLFFVRLLDVKLPGGPFGF